MLKRLPNTEQTLHKRLCSHHIQLRLPDTPRQVITQPSDLLFLIEHAPSTSPGVTAQISPPLNYTRVYSGLYTHPGYILGAPRVYPTSPDYTPSDGGWGIVWEIGVCSGVYYIYDHNQF